MTSKLVLVAQVAKHTCDLDMATIVWLGAQPPEGTILYAVIEQPTEFAATQGGQSSPADELALAAATIWTHDCRTVLKRGRTFCMCNDEETAWFIADRLNKFDANLTERNQWQRAYLREGRREAVLEAALETLKGMAKVEAVGGSKAWDTTFTLICRALDPQEEE
jgi:hypothetical protein